MLMQADNCLITDLGMCGPVDEESSNKIYGIISYIAPEVLLQKKQKTKESDVYSIGMLMWEIFAGHPPFDDRAHDYHLILQIGEGLRPPTLPNMPGDYAQIMRKCWDIDPSKRPTIEELWQFVHNKLKEIYEDKIDFDNDSNINGDNSNNNSLQVHKPHPSAYHRSRILDSEIAKSKTLKSNDSLLSDL